MVKYSVHVLAAPSPDSKPWLQTLTDWCGGRFQVAYSLEPGTSVVLKSTTKPLHLTVAYAALHSVMNAYLEWKVRRPLIAGGALVLHVRDVLSVASAPFPPVFPLPCVMSSLPTFGYSSQDIYRGDREAYRRQLAAAESSSISTVVHNLLGVPAQLELNFGDHMCVP